jgi:SET domain-containing protein
MKDLMVRKSAAGLGLFAGRDYKKGELVIEYTGEVISDDEAQRRGGKYLFELNDDWTIDGKGRQNIARYINHSCKPNCYPELTDNEKQVFIYAKRAIKVDEEFNYNYGKYYFDNEIKPLGCRCDHCQNKKIS